MSDSELPALDNQPAPQAQRPLSRNINGYFGETIDLPLVLRDCVEAASANGWTVGAIPVNETLSLPAFIRSASFAGSGEPTSSDGPVQVYLSTGIHGDEPAGPLAVRQLLRENNWPAGFGLWLCPCLNPTGFLLNRRENAQGLDLNRQYLRPEAAETAAHIAWLERQPSFELCLCLHEDWEAQGFYLYELNPDQRSSFAEAMVARVAQVCPIDQSEIIEGRPAQNGIIRPGFDPRDRPQWPESIYLITNKSRLSYTLEAPSDFSLATRVAALVTSVNTALELLKPKSLSAGPSS